MSQNAKYLFFRADDSNHIIEKKYFAVAENQSLTFPEIDSCIALVFVGNNKLVGFHLVATDSRNEFLGFPGAATGTNIRQSIDDVLLGENITLGANSKFLIAGDYNNEIWNAVLGDVTNGLADGNGTRVEEHGNLQVTYNTANATFTVTK
ncbi:hypothetical protein [Vibrio gazogenes]|uniref:Uncharacterized protein n=1 Tax=Vibrio gazogenes TaxID=687 RepID=A0A1Z2SBL0_VIBGA|nr:hypothetical protein [Vibrio gazogenes]ASA54562.1 hypothetical protein BSQ33_01645 [Vibrio gazogenes]